MQNAYVNLIDLMLKAYLPGTGVILDQEGGSPAQRPAIALGWADVRNIRKLRSHLYSLLGLEIPSRKQTAKGGNDYPICNSKDSCILSSILV
ncbi:hypothetical protein TNIN_393671 [Trichonephila inaurata madagascariensis]|uniref:Uncharacterized protein n=1 Tax=Trichonephila inaurata madagascariensis TaxID=2747483 RepID=A0A8X6YDG3_9ARAC|nr:hypothetical protein TNIN_393671 [Trichonephila inaurata madagascariensis]